MTREEYAATQAALVTVAELIGELDLKGFLSWIDRSHAVAPIMDPTLYRQGAGALSSIEALARSAYHFQKAADAFQKSLP